MHRLPFVCVGSETTRPCIVCRFWGLRYLLQHIFFSPWLTFEHMPSSRSSALEEVQSHFGTSQRGVKRIFPKVIIDDLGSGTSVFKIFSTIFEPFFFGQMSQPPRSYRMGPLVGACNRHTLIIRPVTHQQGKKQGFFVFPVSPPFSLVCRWFPLFFGFRGSRSSNMNRFMRSPSRCKAPIYQVCSVVVLGRGCKELWNTKPRGVE